MKKEIETNSNSKEVKEAENIETNSDIKEIDIEKMKLRLTPLGILKVEEKYSNFDILGILRNSSKSEPRVSDYYKVIYTAYITVEYIDKNKDIEIEFEEFIELLQNTSFSTISQVGVNLLLKRKN